MGVSFNVYYKRSDYLAHYERFLLDQERHSWVSKLMVSKDGQMFIPLYTRKNIKPIMSHGIVVLSIDELPEVIRQNPSVCECHWDEFKITNQKVAFLKLEKDRYYRKKEVEFLSYPVARYYDGNEGEIAISTNSYYDMYYDNSRQICNIILTR